MEEHSEIIEQFIKQLEAQMIAVQDPSNPIITKVDCFDDLEGQTNILVEISDISWQKYVLSLCRDILSSLIDDPYSLPLIVMSLESTKEDEGLFSLTYRGNLNTFFIHYYAPERQRSNPFIVPIYYRKFLDALEVSYTKEGKSLGRGEQLWKKLFPGKYESLAEQQNIRGFTSKNLATQLRSFLLHNLDFIEEIAKVRNDKLVEHLENQVLAPIPESLSTQAKIILDEEFTIVIRSPSAVWVAASAIERRIDAHPFQPHFIEIDQLLSSREDCSSIGDKLRRKRGLSGGATPKGANYVEPEFGVRFIRTQNVTPNWINLSDVVYISHEDHQTLERSSLEEDDVLLTITGALFGQSATVYSECLPANISQHSVRMHFTKSILPRYVSLYLNSKYGQAQIQMHKVGATRSAIDYEGINSLKVPVPAIEVQHYLGAKIRLAERCRFESRRLWKSSMDILFSELGFPSSDKFFNQYDIEDLRTRDYKIKSQNPFMAWVYPDIINLELGPQHFHPRRENVIQKLRGTGIRLAYLNEIARRISHRRSATKIHNIPYVGLADIDNNTGYFQLMPIEKTNIIGTSVLFKSGDILFSKLRPNLNKVSICPSYVDEGCGSTELIVYRSQKTHLPYYIYFVLKSSIGLYQVFDITVGSTLPRVDPEIIDEMLVPLISDHNQKIINQNIKNVFSLLHLVDNLIQDAQSDIEALVERALDINGIVSGNIKPPNWVDIANSLDLSEI